MELKDKKRLKFVTLVKGNSMAFEDRLAYSFLLAYSHGLTVARLARLSRLDRTKTLPKNLARLAELQLVKKENNRYIGVPSEIVRIQVDRAGAESWHERLCYLKLYLPSKDCPLTKKQNAVYCLKLAGKDSTSLIAKLLNVSRATVITAVRRLKEHGLLDALGDPVPVPEEKLAWWEDKLRARKDADGDLEKLADTFQRLIAFFDNFHVEWIKFHPWKSEMVKFGRLCKQYGYPYKAVVSLLNRTIDRLDKLAVPIARVFLQLPRLVERAEEATKQNRWTGDFKGSTSFGLLKCKVNDLVKAELEKMKKAG